MLFFTCLELSGAVGLNSLDIQWHKSQPLPLQLLFYLSCCTLSSNNEANLSVNVIISGM